MAPREFVEIRLVCKADYLDPQLKIKLHEIRNKLRQILHTGRKRFALKKVQPWNSVKVTFDIPKEAVDRLCLLAIQSNSCLIELGILSVEIVGQSNTIVVNNPSTKTNSSSSTSTNVNHYLSQSNYSITTMNSNSTSNSYLHDSWSEYKMKINGVHYYPSQSEMKRYETNISSSHSNIQSSSTTTGLSS